MPAHSPSASSAGLVLAPFRALRYHEQTARDLGLVTSPPYDVINDAAVETLRASHPHNIVRLILPRSGEDVAATLQGWLDEQILVRDAGEALYVYEYAVAGRRVRGLVGALGLRDFAEQVVLPHEDVMAGPVTGRTQLMRATGANLEPILLVYDGDGAASDAVDRTTLTEPAVSTRAADGSEHVLWRIDDPETLAAIAADLAPRQALIADGHHRYAAYRNCQQSERGESWSFGLAMLVDQSRHPLHLGAIHRVAPGLTMETAREHAEPLTWTDLEAGFGAEFDADPDRAWERLADHAGGADDAGAPGTPAFLLTDGDRWAVLHGEATSVHAAQVDTARLHEELLPRWDVDDRRVLYVHDAVNARDRARDAGGVAVLLRAPAVEAVVAASSQGVMLPRKTTSFGPKPRMGLVLRLLAD